MEFRILGPLEVIEDGRQVEVAGQKQRALLAMLLMEANRVVSQGRLVAALWEDDPPDTAQKALQVYVSQLRKVLGKDRLQTKGPGYMLRIAEGELDLERFQRLQEDGRLSEALSLWRGPPLFDFHYERFAQAEIARLEELRLACLEERIENDLASGRHAELIGELDALVKEHPLRERLRAQLMLALYRSARQAEALEAYQYARRALVEELGIEPSKSLRDLHQAILNQDPALDLEETPRDEVTEPPPEPDSRARAAGPKERKLATVLFADLVGSTEIGQDDPERFRLFLEHFFTAMADEVEEAGGTIEKFVGDAVMAAFGAPTAQEDHAERALHAALAMQRRLREEFGDEVELRIGVNTGEVVVGEAREGGSFVSGDVVNVAARLEQAAAPGEVLVGERTASIARGAFEFTEAKTVAAKGKPNAVACRSLLRSLSLARPRGVGGLRWTFVARESELELLEATYRRVVQEREPHLVTIMGDAGVGKTSLVRELWERLAAQTPEPLRRTGRCLPYGRGVTYWPLGEILKEQLGILESDSPDDVRARLGGSEILGVTLGLGAAPDLHPLVAREQLHEAWVDLLERLVAERPAVVLVEDLHWAEEPLLDLVDRLSREVRGPLLLIATARPELLDHQPAWGSRHRNAAIVWLEPLSEDDTVHMAEKLLATGLPPALRRLVLASAEGNPFFIEELLAALIDQGVLTGGDGAWECRALAPGFAVPDSVQSVIAARIDLLAPEAKAALQAAAVVGRVFWLSPVRDLLGGAEPDVRALEERDFIRRRASSTMAGEREFAFKHSLTREVAYGSLPKARRARLHAAMAAWLERVGEGRDEHAPLLAHHYAEAVRPEHADLAWAGDENELDRLRDQALVWLHRAAELAAGRYAIDEQISLLRQAVALETGPAERGRLWREIGHACAVNYDDEGYAEATLKAIETCSGDAELADTYAEAAFHAAVRWQKAEDRQRIDEWSRRALDLDRADGRARARALIARAASQPEEAESAAREAAAIAARLNDAELHSYALYISADLALAGMDYEEAGRIVEQRLEVLRRVEDPDHRADAYWAALPAYLGRARFADARRVAALHDEVTAPLTPHHRLHGIAVLLEVEQLAGDWRRIRELTPRAEQAVGQNTTRCLHNRLALLVCALASEHLGDEEDARRLEALSEKAGGDHYGRVESLIWLALSRDDLPALERLLGEQEQPRHSFLRSRKLAPVAARLDALAALGRREAVEREAPPLLRPGTYLELFALRALGVVREETKLIEKAASGFEKIGLDWHAAETRILGDRVAGSRKPAAASARRADA